MSEYKRLAAQSSEISRKQFGTCATHRDGEDAGLHADTCAKCGHDIRAHPVDIRADLTTAQAQVERLTEKVPLYIEGYLKNLVKREGEVKPEVISASVKTFMTALTPDRKGG